MKRPLLLILICSTLSQLAFSQSGDLWQALSNNGITGLRNATPDEQPEKFQLFFLDVPKAKALLNRARVSGQEMKLDIPFPDGTSRTFLVKERSNFQGNLAAKYPSILSFTGYEEGKAENVIRGSLSPLGFNAIVISESGEIYIDPYNRSTNEYHMVYFTKDHKMDPAMREMIQHDHSLFEEDSPNVLESNTGGKNSPFVKPRSSQVVLHEYHIAIAATGQYTQFWGGTVESSLAAINVAVDRLNSVFVRDAAIRLILVEKNDTLIFTDPNSDPYSGTSARDLTSENSSVLNQRIGVENFDIGHVFTRGCVGTTIGASAGVGTVCNNVRKARGSSCQRFTNNQFYMGVVAHELGHQFGALHTWNNCPPNNDDPVNYNPSAAFEPGSGSTIMSYAGSCQNQDVSEVTDAYYHVNSLEAIFAFTREGGVGRGCADISTVANTAPEVNIPLEDGFFIPVSTPFKLTAEGTDEEGDALTYCWEQYDNDFFISDIGAPEGNDPTFRSFSPTISPTRYFPRLQTLLPNRSNNTEVLPTYNRDLTFRVTVRDNNPEGGGVAWKEVKFKSSDNAGPFLVTSLNESQLSLTAGDYMEINWDVANTDQAPINCQFVNIRLSLDAGLTYPIVLSENTPNDGSAFISIPDTVASFARIMVEAADNIFFDISNFDFSIAPAQDTGLIVNVAPDGVPLHCQPEALEFTINTDALNGFDEALDLSLEGDLPEGLDFSFSNNPVMPGESSVLNLNPAGLDLTDFNLNVIGVANGLDTFRREITFSTLFNNFDDLEQLAPADGANDIILITDFDWNGSDKADAYDIEIATNPSFSDESIVESASVVGDTTFKPSVLFEVNELHFWRIRPINDCGVADFLRPFTFHTATVDCESFSNTTRANIPTRNGSVVESTISVPDLGSITDINVPAININYTVNALRVSLVSPAGTEVILYNKSCPQSTSILRVGFDDDNPEEIVCPPDDRIVFQPVESLSAFAGEATQGDWILRLTVDGSPFGAGALEDWSVEFCSVNEPDGPSIVNKDTLFVPPAQSNTLTPAELSVTDADNGADELVFTLVSVPANGTLSAFGSTTLEVGDQFTQSMINSFEIAYQHDGSDNLTDSFLFVVEDGTGGFLPIDEFLIQMDPDAVVDVNEIIKNDQTFTVFPNPSRSELFLQNAKVSNEQLNIRIFNSQGQLLQQWQRAADGLIRLDVNNLKGGLYVMRIQTEEGIVVKRFVKE